MCHVLRQQQRQHEYFSLIYATKHIHTGSLLPCSRLACFTQQLLVQYRKVYTAWCLKSI
jgi:hypothetical protein